VISDVSWTTLGEYDRLTHNLKAAGSNPAPATKNINKIKDLNVERNTGECTAAKRVNAVST
jgi:hypothetical protein